MTMPDMLRAASINPAKITMDVPEQDYLDGLLLPRGFCTLLSTAGGSGKTTSGLSTAVMLSARGRCRLFGTRDYSKSMKTIAVLGEESADAVSRKLAHEMKDGVTLYHEASDAERLSVVSWMEYSRTQPTPERLFNEKGALTESGRKLWSAIKTWRPDFVFFDTLSSLSHGDYLSDRVAYETIGELNDLASETGAAVIMTAHLVKGGAGKIDENSTADDLTALSRGSAAMVNAARHVIVMVPAPKGSFAGLHVEDGDKLWLAGVKSNVCEEFADTTFPVIRSKKYRTFLASSGGRLLSEEHEERNARTVEWLETVMYHVIRETASSLQPFAESGKMSPESLAADLLSPVTQGASKTQVAKAVDNLIRSERVRVARPSATGTPVLDVDGGPFANPELHLDDRGKPPVFRKGAPDVSGLFDLIRAAVDADLEMREEAREHRQSRRSE